MWRCAQEVGCGCGGLVIAILGFGVWLVGKQRWDQLEESKHQNWVTEVAVSAGAAHDQYQEAQNVMNVGMAIGVVGAFLWLVLICNGVVKCITSEETKSRGEEGRSMLR
eukprot:Skav210646  [mRNA]  locus=scaffold2527:12297:12623:+ [translate_table: standard]